MAIVDRKNFLILLVIGLGLDKSAIATEFLLQIKWDILIGLINESQYYGCNGITFVVKSKQIFITDPECYKNSLAANPSYKAYINEINGGYPVEKANEINENDIYYNEDLSKNYNNNRRMIMMMIIKHPKIFDNNQNESKFLSLPKSSQEVDFSTCFVAQPNGRHVKLHFCYLNNCYTNERNYFCNSFRCKFDESSVISGNVVICSLKYEPEIKVISGILSEGRNTPSVQFGTPIIEFENLSDLFNVFNEKLGS